jgi:hypothetical protein
MRLPAGQAGIAEWNIFKDSALQAPHSALGGSFGPSTQKENLHRASGLHLSDSLLPHLSSLVCPHGGVEEHSSLPSADL